MFFWPKSSLNQYIALMQEAVRATGYELYNGRAIYALFRCRVFHFNWFEYVGGSSRLKRIMRFIMKILVLPLLKVSGKKIIFTFHNKMPHESTKLPLFPKVLMNWFFRHANGIVIHCTQSIPAAKSIFPGIDTSRMFYVPHPNYTTAYHDTEHYSHYTKKPGEIVLTFIGALCPYKCLEVLIESAKKLSDVRDIHFLICGNGSPEYIDKLRSLSDGSNITLDARFIEDGEIPSLMAMSDAVLLPYRTISELNSGASYLAFSFGKTIIGTRTGTTSDIDDQSLLYCYDYTEDEDKHVSRLKDAIMKFYADFKNDEASVKRKGEALREIMIQKHSVEETAKALRKIYSIE
ncbi:MAG: glycosyltransferase [Synergistaceae bacterium]|nr:glycosyltransferase [Synergistaceae bacterium]